MNKKDIASVIVLMVSVCLCVVGVAGKLAWGAGLGKVDGITPVGGALYNTQVLATSYSLYDSNTSSFSYSGLQGPFLGTVTATSIFTVDVPVFILLYYDYNWADPDINSGRMPICFAIWDYTRGNRFYRSCYGQNGWVKKITDDPLVPGYVPYIDGVADFRITNVLTGSLDTAGMCQISDHPNPFGACN